MTLKKKELKILQAAEHIADGIWEQVVYWDPFIRDTIGKQLATAADSTGANKCHFERSEKSQRRSLSIPNL